MKNKHLTITIILILNILTVSADLFAQKGKYGATNEDSVKCVENLSVYKDFLREKSYARAMKYWSIAFNVCPQSSLKMYVDGESIIEGVIKENKGNDARVKELLDTLMLLYDRRIENFGKEGYVLGKKGADQYKYAYPSYQDAFNTLKKSIEIDGNNSQAAALIYYFQAAVKLNNESPKDASFWVEMFNQCVTIIEHNLSVVSDTKAIEAYTSASENILKLADPYLNCEALVEFFNSRFDEKKDDEKWLKNAASILDKKNCTGDVVFFKIANHLHTINPSSESAKNMGIMSIKKGSYNDAVKFFTQALELITQTTDDQNLDAKLADLHLLLAKAHFGTNNYPASRTHAQKAAGYKSNWGEPYMLIGDLYAGSVSTCQDEPDGALKAPYWVAVDMFMKAKSVDPSVANDASQKIAKYSQYFPSTQDAFFYGVTEGNDYTVKCWINVTTKARFR